MCCGPTTVEQTGSRKQHRAGTDGADAANSASDGFQAADDFATYLIVFNGAAAGDEQRVYVSARLPKRFVRDDLQTAICDK